MSETTARMTLDLPLAMKERLEELARTTEKSESRLATEAISSFLDIQEWQTREIQRGIREADLGEFANDDEVAAVFAKWKNAG
jgi:RHH-type transcriptional regulator, rel operon repressor / antitoxin RelB